MQMVKGNRAIRDHAADGKTLHLFKRVKDGSPSTPASSSTRLTNCGRTLPTATAICARRSPSGYDQRHRWPQASPEVADAIDAIAGVARGRGFSQRLKAADRKAIELRAMKPAT